MNKRPLIAATLIFAGYYLAPAPAKAQDETPVKINVQNRTGDLPFSTSIGTDIEHIDVAGGGLILQVPIAVVKGRGLDYNFTLHYDSHFLVAGTRILTQTGQYYQVWNTELNGWLGASNTSIGWAANVPHTTYGTKKMSCDTPDPNDITTYTAFYMYNDARGAKHPLAYQYSVRGSCGGIQDTGPDLTGEGMQSFQTNRPWDGIILADGTEDFPGGTTVTASSMEDANGNIVGMGPGIADTLGRTIVTQQNGTNQILYTVYDSSGTLRTYTVNFSTVAFHTAFNVIGFYGSTIHELVSSRTAVSSIALPNGQSYQFQYETGTYGGVTQVNLPTGGYITYTWATLSDSDKTHRYVSSRTVHANGQTSTWNISRTGTYPTYTSTVTDPLGNQSVYISSNGAVTSAKIYQGPATGNPIRQYAIDYVADSDPWDDSSFNSQDYTTQAVAIRPIRITTTLDDGSVSKKEFDYETFTYNYHDCHDSSCMANIFPYTTSRGNVTEIREYDFGSGTSGPLLRRTDNTYGLNSNSNYLARNIVNKVTQQTTYDGSANQVAQTQYEFDNYVSGDNPLQTTTGAANHDYTNYSSTLTFRGNATRVKRWRNTDSALLTNTLTYDDLGNIRAIKDPLSHTSSYDYTDSFANSFCPPPSGFTGQAWVSTFTNPLGQQIKLTAYPCTSLVQARKDQNDINAGRAGTIYTYDLMKRVLSKNLPNGGGVATTYNDIAPVSSTSSSKITSSLNLVTTPTLDGLGRVSQSQLTSDPQGTVSVVTTYDAIGRKSTVSNPYRSTSDPTYGITTTLFDVLNRTIKLIPPDGSSTANNVSTSYAGRCATVTDQGGKIRKSCSDGLGHLTQVFEPNSSNSLVNETDYQNDVLGNLLCAVQRGTDTTQFTNCAAASATWRPRSFTYNSLSQLLTATNPETGTITYTYDDGGNLKTKKDARNITTTYSYDQINRVSGKTYSNGDHAVTYTYDQSGCLGLTSCDNIGHRTNMTDAAGSEAWAVSVVGNSEVDQRTTNSVVKTTTYGYNLDGSVSTLTYPSGRVVTYTPGAAGRPLSATDNTGISYASNALYAPQGAISSLQNGASIISTLYYNPRLQPCRLAVKNSGTAPTACADTTNIGNVFDFQYDFGLGVSDNGNVNKITNHKGSDTSRSVSYTYDELNRVKNAVTGATSGANCWGQLFGSMSGSNFVSGYDIWGNLVTITPDPSRPGCSVPMLSQGANTNNQISGFCYDQAGNLLAQSVPPCPSPTYSYNAESQLITAVGVTYTYDGDGRRVMKSSGKLYWYGAGSDALDETDLAGNTNNASFKEYVFFGAKRIASRDFSNAVNYYFADHLGTARIVTNSSGTILDDSDFYPYGGERVVISSSGNTYKFDGKERDSESGNDDFGARFYSSSLGRWLSADWSAVPVPVPYANLTNPQTLNLYAIVNDNPVTFADLDGHQNANGGQDPSISTPSVMPQCTDPTKCQKPAENPPPSANTTVANIYKYGQLLSALGALGNAAQSVASSTDITGSIQSGNIQQDTHGDTTLVAGTPAYSANVNVSVNGPKPDQQVIAQPAVGLGKYVQVGTSVVQDSNGNVHTQGGNVSVGVSTPTFPVTVAVPPSIFQRVQSAVEKYFGIEPKFNPTSVPWSNTQIW
jgi:RHS repeat-associated protein